MDYIEGGEIYAKLKLQKKFSEEQCAEVIKNLSEALYCLHR